MPMRPSITLASATLAVVALAALSTGGAAAADLDYGFGSTPPPVVTLPEAKVEFGSGWYVRGDIGVTTGIGVGAGDEPYDSTLFTAVPAQSPTAAMAATPSTSTTVTNPDGSTTTSTTPGSAAVAAKPGNPAYQYPRGIYSGPGQTAPPLSAASSNALHYTASLGAGYQFNRWFRSDLMFDFRQPLQSVRRGLGRSCITGTTGFGTSPYSYETINSSTCTPNLKATLKSYDVLINGYIDLGTYYRFTPYVGAGVGLSFGYASASSQYFQANQVAYNINYVDAVSGATSNQYWDRSQSKQYYNFAFAAMAGVAYDIYPHVKLDLGYRYLHLGQILGVNVATQEARLGLRYMIDN